MTTTIGRKEGTNAGKEKAMVFAWNDSVTVEKANPMALVGRFGALLKHMAAQELEVNPANDGYTVFGLTATVEKLAKAGDYQAVGDLLTALEGVVEAYARAGWPLSETA